MTKLLNILSVEETIAIRDFAYSEKNLFKASKAVINNTVEETTEELVKAIEIELSIAIDDALDDFEYAIFDIADKAVAAEKVRADKRAARKANKKAKAAKLAKRAKSSLKGDLNKESHVLSKELKGEFTMKQVKVSKDFKVACGAEIYFIAVGEPKAIRKGKVNDNAIRFAARVAGRTRGGLVSKLSADLAANISESKAKTVEVVMELDDQFSITRSEKATKSVVTRIRNIETAEHGDNIDKNVVSPSCNEAHMRAFNKDLKEELDSQFFIIDRINLKVNREDKITEQRFCRSIEGTEQQFSYFDVETINTSYKAESYDDHGKLKDTSIRRTGIKNYTDNDMIPAYSETYDDGSRIEWESCKKLSEDLMIVQVEAASSNDNDIKAAKAMASVFAIKGVYVGENEDGTRTLYHGVKGAEECFKNSTRVLGAYKGYYSSTSTLKHSVVYFVKLNCDVEAYYRVEKGAPICNDKINDVKAVKEAIDERFNEVDATTQGSLSYALDKLEAKRLNSVKGDKAVMPNNYSKIFVRPGLLCATPSNKLGVMKNMLIVNHDIETRPEFETSNESVQELMADLGIDNNFSDGAFVVSVGLIRAILKAKGKSDKYSDEQIMSLGLQLRAGLLVLKGFARVYDANMIYERASVLLRLYADDITVVCEQSDDYVKKGIKHAYTGREILDMLDSENNAKVKLAEYIIENLELICSKNEAKAINWDELLNNPNAEANLYLIDAQNASDSESSNQMLNKVLDFAEEEIKETMHVMADNDAFKITDINDNKRITFNRNCTGLGSMASDAIKTLLGDAAKKDAGIMTKIYSSMISTAESKIAKARIDTKSPYLVAVPDDYILGSYFDDKGEYQPLNILGSRMHVDYSPKQIVNGEEGNEVECIEVYSARENNRIRKQIKRLRKHSRYSKEDLAKIEESLRIQTMLKYPSQGPKEFVFVYYVSNNEILNRIKDAEAHNLVTKNRAKALKNFYFKNPQSCIIIAADNSLKNQLAGFDFDGDAIVTVPRVLSEIDEETHELVYGVFDIFGEEFKDKIRNDYTSILVNKYIANGSKYTCCCIVYDKPERVYREKPIVGYGNVRRASAKSGQKRYDKAVNILGATIFGHNAKDENPSYTADDFLNEPLVENFVKIEDRLGLYHACNTIGDDIGMTIVLCSVAIMASIEREIFDENGKFNYDAFKTIFSPLNPGRTDGHYNNPAVNRYKSIFSTEPNKKGIRTKIIATNRFGVKREYYRVDSYSVSLFCRRMATLSKETTKAEWKMIVEDFAHITRALGESTIDAKKDVTKFLGKLVYDIIDRGVRCIGNIKKELIKDNYASIFSATTKNNPFYIDLTEIENHYSCFADSVGDIKTDMAEIYTDSIEAIRAYVVNNTDYSFYEKYNTGADNLLGSMYSNLKDAVRVYINFSGQAAKAGNGIAKLTKYEKEAVMKGLFNLAKLDGVDIVNDPLTMVKIAIEGAFYDSWKEEFIFGKEYNSRLNTIMNIFNELFVLERTGLKTIPVELRLALDCEDMLDDSCNGHNYSFVDGICESNTDLVVDDKFTGSAKCEDGKLIVQYDPMLKYRDCENYLTLSVSKFAKDKGVDITDINFAADGKDIEEGTCYGFNVIDNKESMLYFGAEDIIDQDGNGYTALTLEDEDGDIIAIFDQTMATEDFDDLVGAEFSGAMLAGGTWVVKVKKQDSRYKQEVTKYQYILNGTVNF